MALNFSAFQNTTKKTSSLNLSAFGIKSGDKKEEEEKVKTGTIDRPWLKAQYKTNPDGTPAITPRSTGSLSTKKGFEIDHEIPVSLGGTSKDPNLSYKSDADALDKFLQKNPFKQASRQDGKMVIELKAIDDYKKGRIGLNEARQRVLNWNNQPKSTIKLYAKALLNLKPVKTALSFTSLLGKISPTLKPTADVITSLRGVSTKEQAGEVLKGILDTGRASTLGLSTIPSAIAGGVSKDVSSWDTTKESVKMATDMWTKNEVGFGNNVDKAAQMYLKKQKVGKYGGEPVQVKDVVVLGGLGIANIFGDPAFAVGLGLKGYRALKEFKEFKKVGVLKEEVPRLVRTKKVRGVYKTKKPAKIEPFEIKISEDLKVKVKPKSKEIVFEGYQKRFPTQKGLPAGARTKETADLIQGLEKTTGLEMKAKMLGDNLVIKPVVPSVQPIAKTVDPLIQEATKYKSAEEFVRAQGELYHGTQGKFEDFLPATEVPEEFQDSSGVKTFGTYFTDNKKLAKQFGDNIKSGFINKNKLLDLTKIKSFDDLVDALPIDQKVNDWELRNMVSNSYYDEYKPTDSFYKPLEDLVNKFNLVSKLKEMGYEGLIYNDVENGVKGKTFTVFEPKNIKTKSQLTDIWNKAQEVEKPIKELVYKSTIKTSGLAQSVKSKAIRDKMIYGFDRDFRNLPDYDKRIKIEDTALATDYVLNDTENAIKVAMGEMKPPRGMLPEDVYVAVNKYATAIGNVRLIKDLGTKSGLLSESTVMGQRIQALSGLNADDIVKKVSNLKKVREEAYKQKNKVEPKKKLTEEQKKINREIKAVKKSQKDLDEFIKSIIC